MRLTRFLCVLGLVTLLVVLPFFTNSGKGNLPAGQPQDLRILSADGGDPPPPPTPIPRPFSVSPSLEA